MKEGFYKLANCPTCGLQGHQSSIKFHSNDHIECEKGHVFTHDELQLLHNKELELETN